MTKKLDSGPILAHLAKVRPVNFFEKDLAASVTGYHGQL